jgi:hypothetical protein
MIMVPALEAGFLPLSAGEITTALTSSPKRCRVRAEPGMRARWSRSCPAWTQPCSALSGPWSPAVVSVGAALGSCWWATANHLIT